MHRGHITLMWGWSALLGLLLFLPAHGTQCGNDVPADCEFNKTDKFCGWEHHNWTRDSSRDGYAFLEGGTLSGYMKSKERCVSSHISHCLKFRFRLKRNETDSLSVSIVWPENNMKLVLWNYSSQTIVFKDSSQKVTFTDAKVAVCSDSNFQLVISARSPNPRRIKDISVDRFKYETDSCDIEPLSAKPPTATLPTTTNATPKTTTATTTTMMTSSTPTSTKRKFPTITETTTAIETSSSKTGIIIGIFLSVIGAVVYGVVVCIVFRRRRNPLMAMLSARMKNHQEDSGNHNPAVVSVGENCNEVNTTNCQDRITPQGTKAEQSWDLASVTFTSNQGRPISAVYEISPGGANNVNSRQRDYQDASSVLQTSTRTHGRLDCTNAESDRSAHTGLRVDSPAQQSAGGASVYESLQEQKDVHVYNQIPGVYQN